MLNKDEIKELIKNNNLIERYIDLNYQLQPNGFDITVDKIYRYDTQGKLDFSNSERIISDCVEIKPEKEKGDDKYGWWQLKKGGYKIKTNEKVNLPNNLAALAFSRSSLLRNGAFTVHGVWDAGFSGKSEFLIDVKNPNGLKIKENARIAQMVFIPIDKVDEGYRGIMYGKE